MKLTYYQNEHLEENNLTVWKGSEKREVVVERGNNYHPFGLAFNSYNNSDIHHHKNLYKYNGKEEQKETGWYDYGARNYDPALGRFFNQDRFAEKYYRLSPYQYAANNPVKFIDVNGDSIIAVTINDKSGFIHGTNRVHIDHTILDDLNQILHFAAGTGTHIRINSSFRTNVRQQELQGNTGSLTPASPGKSAHNAGLALDFNVYTNNDPSQGVISHNTGLTSKNSFIDAIKNDSWSPGWRWGGDFKDSDPIHIDKKPNKSVFEKIRDANQSQMNGNIESSINESYISRNENISIGGTAKSERKLSRIKFRSTLRSLKKVFKRNE